MRNLLLTCSHWPPTVRDLLLTWRHWPPIMRHLSGSGGDRPRTLSGRALGASRPGTKHPGRGITYFDDQEHPDRQDYHKLAAKPLMTFQDIISGARREARDTPASEAVRCDAGAAAEACDAGAAATQERRRRSDAGATQRRREGEAEATRKRRSSDAAAQAYCSTMGRARPLPSCIIAYNPLIRSHHTTTAAAVYAPRATHGAQQ
mgnify:CR=1 FL=1